MVAEGATKVATTVVDVMRGAPVILALLLVNAAFLGFVTYLMGHVAANASLRNTEQTSLILQLVRDIRECRTGTPNQKSMLFKDVLGRPNP